MTLKFIVCLGAFVEDLVAFKFCRDNYMLLTCDSNYILYSCIIFFSTKKKVTYMFFFLREFQPMASAPDDALYHHTKTC